MPGQTTHPAYSPTAKLITVAGYMVGGATSAAAKVAGDGFTIAWTATGRYTITFATQYGLYLGCQASIMATNPATAIKGYTAHPELYSASAFTLAISVYDGADTASRALADLAAAQWLSFVAYFRGVGVGG